MPVPEEDQSEMTATAAQRWPFWPWGLVPLLGLAVLMVVALGPFAFGEVQAATEASARKALDEAGADWAKMEVSGQWVTLEGEPPSREAAAQAVAAVKRAKSGTLFGEAAPATLVLEHFTWVEDPLLGPGGQPRIGERNDVSPPPPPLGRHPGLGPCRQAGFCRHSSPRRCWQHPARLSCPWSLCQLR